MVWRGKNRQTKEPWWGGFAALQDFRITARAESLFPFCGAALEVKPPLGLGKGWLGSNLPKCREAEVERTQITAHRSLVTGTW